MSNQSIAIIGAGIAGCASARLLADYGYQVAIFEQAPEIATGGSGNPVAMLYPRLSGDNIASWFALKAFEFSLAFYGALNLPKETFEQCGLLQLGFDDKTLARIQQAASTFCETTQLVDANQASDLAGLACDTPALYIKQAALLKPRQVCQQLLDHPNITLACNTETSKLSSMDWFDHVILCNAHQAAMFEQTQHLALNPVRGQVSLLSPTTESTQLKTILCSNGYLSPVVDSKHSLGATFEADVIDLSISDAAHIQNLNKLDDLPPSLSCLKNSHWQGRVGLRCVTQDRLPMVGGVLDTHKLGSPLPRASLKQNTLPWHTHLWVNVAHGSHGFINAPYSAYLLTQLITQHATPAELNHLTLLNPNRFYLRHLGFKKLARTVASADMSTLHFATALDLS